MKSAEKILQFVHNEWDDRYAYKSTDIAEILGCNPRLARYYLMSMVKVGELAQIKVYGKTYYVRYYQAYMFKKYRPLGLTIKQVM